MSTHRHIDRICAAAAVLVLLLTLLFVNGEALGVQPASKAQGYEARLFDVTQVHTVEIVMDGWDEFLETCENEEYSACSVIVDGEAYKNVGIRAKGNTSLSTVSSMGSDRYSFKIEFDHYDGGKTYHGLDKLCLNNIIQDNTYMKDYLVYQMMGAYGVNAPLCSYAFITVNGEDWGLYLAVEGVEDSFLQRNYGGQHGELYKPDSLSFGGGRGNGRDFEMGDFIDLRDQAGGTAADRPGRTAERPAPVSGGETPEESGSPAIDGGQPPAFEREGPSPMSGGFGGMGSSDVKLQYSDDDPESYSNIFSSAKTDVTPEDQARLIQSLKILSQGGDVESAVDIDKVLRYFTVHNFVVNGDSYTGSMVHNYYLYEESGRLSMIPWDYNLAFGTFQAGSASAAVNDPIDTPLSVTGSGDRPMIDWIFCSEEYTQLYHRYFADFLETVDPVGIVDETYALIAPYVERDPTKFCTYEEFETGTDTLKAFCRLRAESVSGQLAGTIPSTGDGQSAAADSLVDTGGMALSDMGTMEHGGGPGGGGHERREEGETGPRGAVFSDRQPADAGGDEPGGEQAPGGPGGMGFPGGGGPEGVGFRSGSGGTAAPDSRALPLVGVSIALLLAGMLAAFRYRRWG